MNKNKIEFLGKKWHLAMDRYREGNGLAILLNIDESELNYEDDEDIEYFDYSIVLTVNIEGGLFLSGDNCAYLDINNFGNELIEMVKRYKLGSDVYCAAESGMCVYPQYAFDLDECKKYSKGE